MRFKATRNSLFRGTCIKRKRHLEINIHFIPAVQLVQCERIIQEHNLWQCRDDPGNEVAPYLPIPGNEAALFSPKLGDEAAFLSVRTRERGCTLISPYSGTRLCSNLSVLGNEAVLKSVRTRERGCTRICPYS